MIYEHDIGDFDPKYIGSSFEDWLEEEGIADEVFQNAIEELNLELVNKTLIKLNV